MDAETRGVVESLQVQIREMQPVMKKAAEDTAELLLAMRVDAAVGNGTGRVGMGNAGGCPVFAAGISVAGKAPVWLPYIGDKDPVWLPYIGTASPLCST